MNHTYRTDETKKKLNDRINRIKGQVNGISKMIDKDRYCDDILIQLSAINNSLKSLANEILENHLKNCVVSKIKEGDESIIDDVMSLVKRFQ